MALLVYFCRNCKYYPTENTCPKCGKKTLEHVQTIPQKGDVIKEGEALE